MKERQESLQQVKERQFDLVVIGGGLAGAAAAWGASSRGLSVLLLERADFASGSSGTSNQLFHADLPYWGHLSFSENRRLSDERDGLKKLAPHLIKDCSFLLPLIHKNNIFNLKLIAGVALNDLMAFASRRRCTHKYLDRKKVKTLVPFISEGRVWGGLQFEDAVTNDARLVFALVKAACKGGAVALNYIQASGFRVEENVITGVCCHDRYSGQEFVVSCKLCVNASGGSTDELLGLLPAQEKPRFCTSRTTRIIVPASAFETNSALLLSCDAGGFVYVLPWQHSLMIGSLPDFAGRNPFHSLAQEHQIELLLGVVNSYTENERLSLADIRASFNCSETMAYSGGVKQEIIEGPCGLVSLVGVEPAMFRVRAEQLMERLAARYSWLPKSKKAQSQHLPGGWESRAEFPRRATAIEAKARKFSIDPASIDHLISSYGSDAERVIDLVEREPALKERILADFPVILAEVPFSVENEMTISLQDFLLRRSRLALLNEKQALEAAPVVADLMAKMLGWDNYRIKMELSALEQEILEPKKAASPVGI